MRRIGLAVVLLFLVALAADAQQAGRVPRIGLLSNSAGTTANAPVEAFRQGLRRLGWIEGQTVMIEYRSAEGNPDRLPALAAELVQAKVDVIVLSGAPAIRAAQKATSTIPSSSSPWPTRSPWDSCRASRAPAET